MPGSTPYGNGLTKLNKNSEVLWEKYLSLHHSLHVTKNGQIAVLSHHFIDAKDITDKGGTQPQVLDDILHILDSDGNTLKSVPLLALVEKAGLWKYLCRGRDEPCWDVLHANSVMMLEDDMSIAFPMFKSGQVLVSLRNLNMIVVVDIDEEKIVWWRRGGWVRQHDARFLADGRIMMFDNRGAGAQSRIITYTPLTGQTDILYGNKPKERFYSQSMGVSHMMPNGNILTTEATKGRIFEFSPDREIVWDYHTPYFRDMKSRAVIAGLKRHPADYFTFITEPDGK
jgi:hypothetical protein